jgi:hypothetical protein
MINIIALWTSEIDAALEHNIMSCFNETFSQTKDPNYFQWKFRDNPFGESLHVIAVNQGRVIGSRVFWRLDIEGYEAYQCVDTSILPEYQGKGLFKSTVLKALDIIGDKLIYNYPNELSGPAYIKSGWKVVKNSTSIKVNLTNLMVKSSPVLNWDEQQLRWRFEKNPLAKYYTMKKKDYYYVFSLRRKGLFVLLFKTKYCLDLEFVKPRICFSYDQSVIGLRCHSKLPYMSRCVEEHNLLTYLFDMA